MISKGKIVLRSFYISQIISLRICTLILFFCLCDSYSLYADEQKYHDAAMFDAYGNIKYIENREGRIYFHEDGSLDKEKSDALNMFKKYDITRDSDGYPTKVETDLGQFVFIYNNHKLYQKHVYRNWWASKEIPTEKTTYEEGDVNKKYLTKEIKQDNSGISPVTSEKFFNARAKDINGNWIFRTEDNNKSEDIFWEIKNGIRATENISDLYKGEVNYLKYENRLIAYYGKTIKQTEGNNDVDLFYILEHPFYLDVPTVSSLSTKKKLRKAVEIVYKKDKNMTVDVVKSTMNRLGYVSIDLKKSIYGYPFYFITWGYVAVYQALEGKSGTPWKIQASINYKDKKKYETDYYIFAFLVDQLRNHNIPYYITSVDEPEVTFEYKGNRCVIGLKKVIQNIAKT